MNGHATIESVHEPSARRDAAYARAVETSLIARRPPASEQRPYVPGSILGLWDMLRVYATDLVLLIQTLDRLWKQIDKTYQTVTSTLGGFAQDRELQKEACAALWDAINPLLEQVIAACERIELKDPAALVERLRDRCSNRVYSVPELQGSLRSLGELIEAQLDARVFMCMTLDVAEYWSDAPLFGEKAQKRLPKAVDDMIEAGKCLAVGRSTASVFHLMRVVEVGAKHFATRKCKLSLPHRANLGDIVKAINGHVAKMPTSTQKDLDRKTSFSQAADHLSHIKDGWRNKTMHPGLSYDEEEAKRMFKNVAAFMNSLVGL